jgi:iron complex outermembrane recepter protein
MKKFTIKPLVLAVSVLTLPCAVYAQDTESVEEVIVTGSFRESLANAVNIKKNQSGFVDAIVASDIAEFPDNNLAESLQRVPGVAITRSGGEGRQIAVRGLGSTFTTVRLNGMETISTTGGTDAVGGNNRGRGFDFNTFSSDLFSSLVVRKTNSAEIQEGSLGATVDLKAAQPFDYDGLVITAAGSLGYNDLSEENDPGASFLISNTFADETFGVLFSFSASERKVQDEGSSTVRWSNEAANQIRSVNGELTRTGGTAGYTTKPATLTDFETVNGWCWDDNGDQDVGSTGTDCVVRDRSFIPRIPRYDSYNHEMERLGASLSLQWRPTETTELSLDHLAARFDATREEIFLQGSLNPGTNATTAVLADNYIKRGDTLVYGQLSGVRLLSEARYDEFTTDFSQTTLTLKQEFTERLRLNAMIGTTTSDYDNPIQNTVIMRAANQTLTFDYTGYDNADLTFGSDAYVKSSWATESIRQRPQTTQNQNDAISTNVEFDFNDNLTLKVGVDFKDFSFETDQFALASEGNNSLDIQANPNYIISYDSGLGAGTPWLIPNRALIMASNSSFWTTPVINYGSTYEVGEETAGVFAQLNFDYELSGMPVKGDVGIRQFKTDQSTSGWLNGTLPSREYVTVEHDYDDLLPALNVSIEPVEDVLVRAAYSEGISRAPLGSIVPAVNVSVAGTSRSVGGANPFLEPTKAKSYDLGVEWYFSEGGLVSFTLFKKEIESHVQTLRSSLVYSTTNLPVQSAINACALAGRAVDECNQNVTWDFSVPTNGPGGDLDGFELSYQQPFTFLPGFLSNFGFMGSYTNVESDLTYLSTAGLAQSTKPLINLSDETTSATIYFENDTFNGRVSLASRSGYLTQPIGSNGNAEHGTNGTVNVDASFGYQINDNFKVTLEALNLTDEADDQWVGSEGEKRLSYYHTTGRQFNLGVQYKY